MAKEVNRGSKPFSIPRDSAGQEIPDPRPIDIPLGFRKPESLEEKITRMVKSAQLAELASKAGFETPEEADDFDVPGDEGMDSPFEENFEGEFETFQRIRKNKDLIKKVLDKTKRSTPPPSQPTPETTPLSPLKKGAKIPNNPALSDSEAPA